MKPATIYGLATGPLLPGTARELGRNPLQPNSTLVSHASGTILREIERLQNIDNLYPGAN